MENEKTWYYLEVFVQPREIYNEVYEIVHSDRYYIVTDIIRLLLSQKGAGTVREKKKAKRCNRDIHLVQGTCSLLQF